MHFINKPFLEALGRHCQKLRTQKGFSIDRLAKESEQLSTSVIHRLESGSGAVTVSALFRYAQALGIELKELLDFDFSQSAPIAAPEVLESTHPLVKKEAYKTLLPLYSLKAAAGHFTTGTHVEPEGWVAVKGKRALDRKMFVARAKGNSMLPSIRDGDMLVFRADPTGTKQGRVVLTQYRGPADPETGGSFTVKKYQSSKVAGGRESEWRNRQIVLSPTNPEYEPIILNPKDERDFRIVAEYLFTLT